MLGSNEVKTIYNSYNSVYAQPKVVAEWNANMFAEPYVAACGNFGAITDSPTYKTASNTTITADADGRGSGTISFTDLVLTEADAIRISFTAKATSPIESTVSMSSMTSSSELIDSKSKKIDLGYVSQRYVVEYFQFDYVKNTDISKLDMAFNFLGNSGDILTIEDIEMYKISRLDAKNNNETPISSIYSKRLAGEAFVDYPSTASTMLSNNANICPHNIIYLQLNNEKDSSGKDLSRNFIPSKFSKYKYFITYATDDIDIFIKYKNSFKMNKLVLKANSAHHIPSSISFSLLNSSGVWEEQTISGLSNFDNNGLLVLYWNGTNWSKDQWETIPYLSNGSISISPKTAEGVKVSFDSFTVINYDTRQESDYQFHLVEVSPRYDVDLSLYVETLDINKELSNDSLPLPIGISNSNSASVTFTNIPDIINDVNIFPFSNDSTVDSPLRGIIDKNVKFKISFITYDENDTAYETQAATMYTASWTTDFQMTSKAECFDISKNLSTIQTPIIYERSISPEGAVARLLDSVGCTDYDYSALVNSGTEIIQNYWTVRDKSILQSIQEVLLPYQVSMIINEYGIIEFQKLSDIVNVSSSSPELVVTDSDYDSYKSNIISYNEEIENRPSQIAVGYTIINPKDTVVYPNGNTAPQYSKIWTAPAEMLGLAKLYSDLSSTATELKYKYDPQFSLIQSFTGYLLIDQEILSFEGQEWKINGDTKIVKSSEDLEYYKKLSMQDKNFFGSVSAYPMYKLHNLKRGLFGTTPANHTISYDLSTKFITVKDQQISPSVGTRSSASNLISKDDFGMKILPSSVDSITNVAFINQQTNGNHKVYSGTFSLDKEKASKLPPKNKAVRFGLILGAQSNTPGGRVVELSIKRHRVGSYIIARSMIKTYRLDSSLNRVDEKVHTLYDAVEKIFKNGSGKIKTKGNRSNVLNLKGQNTITAILSDDNKKLAVLVNGNVIHWEGESVSDYIKVTSSYGSTSFSIPSLNLSSAVTTNGRYFGAFNFGPVATTVNALNAFELKYDGSLNTAETISTIAWGNQYNLSYKNELESIFTETFEKDQTPSIDFVPTAIAREVKIFDIDYQAVPATSSQLIRNISVLQGGRNGQPLTVPGDAIAMSTFLGDTSGAKFALMNAYSEPVYLNASTNNDSSTFIVGTPLEPKSQKYIKVSSGINDESTINLQSDWIQNERSARKILSMINSLLIMKKSSLEVEIFGNPLIQVGDVVGFRYEQKSIDLKNYLVVAAKIGYNNGITTSIKLRRIQE